MADGTYRMKRLGDLDVIERSAEGASSGPCIIMLHGYGADFRDLAPLAEAIPCPPGTNWLFPNGPLEVPVGPHMSGRAWFPIDMQALEAAMMRGRHRDFSQSVPDGFAEASQLISQLISHLDRPMDQIFLGGFSQGGMIACDVGLCGAESPRGLILLSTTLVARQRWQAALGGHSGLPIFQSHGQSDAILSFQDAQELHHMFEQQGAKAEFHGFDGGHEIPPPLLKEIGRFIQEIQ